MAFCLTAPAFGAWSKWGGQGVKNSLHVLSKQAGYSQQLSCPGPSSQGWYSRRWWCGAAFFSWICLLLRPVLYLSLAPLLYLAQLNKFGNIINENIPLLHLLTAARLLLLLLSSLCSAGLLLNKLNLFLLPPLLQEAIIITITSLQIPFKAG